MEAGHRTAIDAKDIDGVLKYYASDLITVSAGEPIQYGKDWIRTTLTDLYKTYDFHEDFKFKDIRIIGERVVASFTYTQSMTPLAGGKSTKAFGKGMGVFRTSDASSWQFEWNSYGVDSTQSAVKD
jgi:ketosteroid isomerase-like protein